MLHIDASLPNPALSLPKIPKPKSLLCIEWPYKKELNGNRIGISD